MGRQWSRLGRRAQRSIACFVIVMAVALLVVLFGGSHSTAKVATGATSSSSSSTSATEQHPTTTSPSTTSSDPLHPNPALTPGATFAGIAREQVCVRGYSASVRSVSASTRDQVFAEYGLSNANRSDYEVDHLVSLELGGSNDITNLWPQPLHDPSGNGAVDKDQIENDVHSVMCAGEVSLADAQRAIVHWDSIDLGALVSTTTTAATFAFVAPTTSSEAAAPAGDCTPGYDPCIPPGSDVDCAGGSGDGPRYVQGPVYVTGSDPYRLDANHDGVACA